MFHLKYNIMCALFLGITYYLLLVLFLLFGRHLSSHTLLYTADDKSNTSCSLNVRGKQLGGNREQMSRDRERRRSVCGWGGGRDRVE